MHDMITVGSAKSSCFASSNPEGGLVTHAVGAAPYMMAAALLNSMAGENAYTATVTPLDPGHINRDTQVILRTSTAEGFDSAALSGLARCISEIGSQQNPRSKTTR